MKFNPECDLCCAVVSSDDLGHEHIEAYDNKLFCLECRNKYGFSGNRLLAAYYKKNLESARDELIRMHAKQLKAMEHVRNSSLSQAAKNALSKLIYRADEAAVTELHPLQKEFGFDRPEDGSGDRYKTRRTKFNAPWTTHTVWWVIHNAIAHVMIAFLPFRPFFSLHDYTSRKMHGQ